MKNFQSFLKSCRIWQIVKRTTTNQKSGIRYVKNANKEQTHPRAKLGQTSILFALVPNSTAQAAT